ncbi:MAG: carboxypeptidase-like regulatory domain-containing protein [Planctomycetaceae bacterium]|jgi:hypothetical protein|nr:carboxypeptidase-like regulatory domain-containing protein [Planctomycetaceae bacterium]
MLRFNSFFVLLCFFIGIIIGCGEPNDPRAVNLVPGKGILKMNGNPLSGANIILTPVQGTADQHGASGLTNENGTFQLTTFRSGDGIYPGNYAITVFKTEIVSAPSAEEIAQYELEAKSPPPSEKKAIVPEKYNKIETSGLTLEVPPKGKKDIVIEISSQERL